SLHDQTDTHRHPCHPGARLLRAVGLERRLAADTLGGGSLPQSPPVSQRDRVLLPVRFDDRRDLQAPRYAIDLSDRLDPLLGERYKHSARTDNDIRDRIDWRRRRTVTRAQRIAKRMIPAATETFSDSFSPFM